MDDHGGKLRSYGDDWFYQSRTVRLLGQDLCAAKPQNVGSISPGMKITRTTRPPLLEQGLLSRFRGGANLCDSSGSIQLTMFYGGTVHVYDDVPFDKAQAIMLLASESSSPKPTFASGLNETEQRTDHTQPIRPSICNLESDLPIARKNSLRSFLQKRHNRITSKAPYAAKPAPLKETQLMPIHTEPRSVIDNSSLSPFPTHLGYFSRVPKN